ncbi:MAG: hypothetical protein ACI8X5_000121 [Planctomycetota bacterium]|jgi:hypothetical protein
MIGQLPGAKMIRCALLQVSAGPEIALLANERAQVTKQF